MTVMPARVRETWVDVVKGMAIVLVVLHHTVLAMNAIGWEWEPVVAANASMQTFRMPLFFFASGLFFAPNLTRPLRWFLRDKVGGFVYLYVLWSIVHAAFFAVVPSIFAGGSPLRDLLMIFLWPSTGLWYLYALAIYFLAVRALSVLPAWLQWALAVGITFAFASGIASSGNWALDSIFYNFAYFFAAIRLRRPASQLAAEATWLHLIAASCAWLSMSGAVYLLGWGITSPMRVPLSFVAIVLGISLAAVLDRTLTGRGLEWLGRRTLPIYVLHFILIAGLFAAAPAHAAPPPLVSLLVTVATVPTVGGVALGIWQVLRRMPGALAAPWLKSPTRAAV